MFTVVIPVYNHARYLPAAVDSALASPLVREVLLVDDGSSDDSAAVAARLARVHSRRVRDLTERPPVNKGAHVRLNELCWSAAQPWIAVLNSDDLFLPHRFETAEMLIRFTGCEFLSGSIQIIDEEGRPAGLKRGILHPEFTSPSVADLTRKLDERDLRRVLCNQNILATTSNMLFRRDLHARVGGFADLRYTHDWDFALRAALVGRCLWTPCPLTAYRVHSTNTIKEPSPHVDGEIARFFYAVMRDFPALEAEAGVPLALAENRRLGGYVPVPASPAPPAVGMADGPSPLSAGARRVLANVSLCLACFEYESVFVAFSLSDSFSSGDWWRASPGSLAGLAGGEGKPGPGLVRRMRLPGANPSDRYPGLMPANEAEIATAFVEEAAEPPVLACLRPGPFALLANLLAKRTNRPRCLILPVFFAVGGAERNLVEVMQELRDDYEFIVVTTERHHAAQGSLHHQLDALDIPCIDLGEISSQVHHLAVLAVLSRVLAPKLVLIANGSPWILRNSLLLRRLFIDVPIIDHQVYDDRMGWIEHYANTGIQSFDQFIAINRRIERRFLRQLRIPRHRVELIYHAINSRRVAEARVVPTDRSKALATAGAPLLRDGARVFAFVGRLSEQKRPLRYLELAWRSQAQGSPDLFFLVGNGPLEAECMDFVRTHRMTQVVRIPYHENPPRLLAVVDALVMTSAYEGLPIVMLESLGVGTPAFSTDAGDVAPLLTETGAGRTCPVEANDEEMWAAFECFCVDLKLLKTRAMETRDEVLERFSSRSIGRSYKEAFERAISRFHEQREAAANHEKPLATPHPSA